MKGIYRSVSKLSIHKDYSIALIISRAFEQFAREETNTHYKSPVVYCKSCFMPWCSEGFYLDATKGTGGYIELAPRIARYRTMLANPLVAVDDLSRGHTPMDRILAKMVLDGVGL